MAKREQSQSHSERRRFARGKLAAGKQKCSIQYVSVGFLLHMQGLDGVLGSHHAKYAVIVAHDSSRELRYALFLIVFFYDGNTRQKRLSEAWDWIKCSGP